MPRTLASAAQRARARRAVRPAGGRGRPSEPAITRFLRDATIELLAKRPISLVTVDEICKRAGVGRPSFYRRFASVDELLTLAVEWMTASLTLLPVSSEDVGEELALALHELARHTTRTSAGRALRALPGQVSDAPNVTEALFRHDERRRQIFTSIFERGAREGRLRAGLDHDTAYEVTVGAIMMRAAYARTPELEGGFIRTLCDIVLVPAAKRPPPDGD